MLTFPVRTLDSGHGVPCCLTHWTRLTSSSFYAIIRTSAANVCRLGQNQQKNSMKKKRCINNGQFFRTFWPHVGNFLRLRFGPLTVLKRHFGVTRGLPVSHS